MFKFWFEIIFMIMFMFMYIYTRIYICMYVYVYIALVQLDITTLIKKTCHFQVKSPWAKLTEISTLSVKTYFPYLSKINHKHLHPSKKGCWKGIVFLCCHNKLFTFKHLLFFSSVKTWKWKIQLERFIKLFPSLQVSKQLFNHSNLI